MIQKELVLLMVWKFMMYADGDLTGLLTEVLQAQSTLNVWHLKH